MSKQNVCQRFVFKIHSERLRKNKWKLNLSLREARENDELIALADSQVLRWIDDMNGLDDVEEKSRSIRHEIKMLKKEPVCIENKRKIRKLYADLDDVQFKKDYLCLIIDKKADYIRACKGFEINGIKYSRLLGTNGGIKNSTIVFINSTIVEEIRRRIENDRNPNQPLVTAKLEAYKSLACSASVPVSMPKGILVVDDCITHFCDKVIKLSDKDCDEPIIEIDNNCEIELNASDGFGIMLPSLAKRWSDELNLDFIVSGINTRFSFEKGMVFTFDFLDFAEKENNGAYIVKDAWGNDVDVRNVEIILTTSMVKLWDGYDSCDDYVSSSVRNGYTFAVTKNCPKELENERRLNYQFIQSYDLSDEDIDELIKPTVDELKDVLGGDWKKTILFLKGIGLTDRSVKRLENDYTKAIMLNHDLVDDSYIKNKIFQLIKKRINEAKIGKIKVHGNFSIVSGDPFALCQHIFGLEVTGLLKRGQIYNKYWLDCGSTVLACFRAPMSCHNNIRKVVIPSHNEKIDYWFKYMNTCTIFNAWDTSTMALNGMDFDGDLVMLTDNDVLVGRQVGMPTLMCEQRRGDKKVSTEADFIQSNIDSFGNEIGKTTNWITTMFDVKSGFEKDTEEYKTLVYRIMCGQLYQQNAIDKAKGIICKPMPSHWHNRRTVKSNFSGDIKDFNLSIVADKKPYFMRYIYPELMTKYNNYVKNSNRKCCRLFEMSIEELLLIDKKDLSKDEQDFLDRYKEYMPVSNGNCVVNRICKKIEYEFDGYVLNQKKFVDFDYSSLKTSSEYKQTTFKAIKKTYEEYRERIKQFAINSKLNGFDPVEVSCKELGITEEFKRDCYSICNNGEELLNIMIDICGKNENLKKDIWKICIDEIIEILLKRNDGYIDYPIKDDNGSIYFSGYNFSIATTRIKMED